ncbi:hypothetical protein PYCCODRAFT_1422509 [Trametes coccinea BRFM310]|uniref:Uncharacterized protein n=1 Tax=Trametes coccinea (strain BRFM310) TaxID=1353009 RepID=A0A1Y2J0V3_TRAC3|nr:hypothetical protein PYCCODRAFT_1422509 [Trametes coccinea BRFM310]
MIFTTVIVTCLFALLGVFQQASVDTFLSSLSHLNTPTLSSVTATFLQVTGSVTRVALDPAPVPEVASIVGRLIREANIGDNLMGFTLEVQDLPVPASFHFVDPINVVTDSLPVTQTYGGSQYGITRIFLRLCMILALYAYRDVVYAFVLDPLADQLRQVYGTPQSQTIPTLVNIMKRSTMSSALTTLAEARHVDAAELDHAFGSSRSVSPVSFDLAETQRHVDAAVPKPVFGHMRSLPMSLLQEEVEDEEEDYDAYLRCALNVMDDGGPPAAGWYLEEAEEGDEPPLAVHPDVDELNAWTLPWYPAEVHTEDMVAIGAG